MINQFRDDFFFLSNFYAAPIRYNGYSYRNTEAAFQAQKTLDENQRVQFIQLNPSDAKRKGRHVNLRPDWEDVKDNIMYEIVLAKFTQNESLRKRLIATGNEELIEGNDWGDQYWGVSNGSGKNKLGQILMRVREEVKNLG